MFHHLLTSSVTFWEVFNHYNCWPFLYGTWFCCLEPHRIFSLSPVFLYFAVIVWWSFLFVCLFFNLWTWFSRILSFWRLMPLGSGEINLLLKKIIFHLFFSLSGSTISQIYWIRPYFSYIFSTIFISLPFVFYFQTDCLVDKRISAVFQIHFLLLFWKSKHLTLLNFLLLFLFSASCSQRLQGVLSILQLQLSHTEMEFIDLETHLLLY